MNFLFASLFLIVILAFVGGQARLTWRALASGQAGWGRIVGDRKHTPIVYWLWIALYFAALSFAILYAVGIVQGFFLS